MQACCTLDVSLDADVLYFGCFFRCRCAVLWMFLSMQACCTLDVSLDAGVLYFGCFFRCRCAVLWMFL